MKTPRLNSLTLLAAALALLPIGVARADEATSHIAFSNLTKPGTLKISVWQGTVRIHGADVKDVAVKTETTAETPTPREDGMRVLSATSSYRLSENANVVSLEYGTDGWGGAPADFEITVPKDTSIVVTNSIRGDFDCTGLSGDIDVRTLNGDVALNDISGGASVETMNGEINVGVKALREAKPLSFSSMNGKVTIRVPGDAKAAIRFRTHHGQILTNFDDKALVTVTQVSKRGPKHPEQAGSSDVDPAASVDSRPEKPEQPEKPEKPEAPEKPEQPEKAESAAPRAESDNDWQAEVRDSIREAAEDSADAAREAADALHEGLAEFHVRFSGTIPPIPPLPPMTGGKVVSGALNGGGVEIQASTLNGDIILKKGG
jgi:Putative adhesin